MRLDHEDLQQLQKDRKSYAPRKLPKTRPRALTFPQIERPARKWNLIRKYVPQHTLEQLQCPLFAQVPTEVRHIIWIEAVGHHVLHIVRVRKRLLAIDCAKTFESIGPDLETSHHGCWGRTTQMANPSGFYEHARTAHPARPANLLPLLQTCRRIYQETIPILYETNIFDINHVDTLAYLRRSVLPRRLDQIRTLNFTCYFKSWSDHTPPYDLDTWIATCDSLARMAGLEELTLHMTGYEGLSVAGRRNAWHARLQPLMKLKIAKRFEIFLSETESRILQMDGEVACPFKLSPRITIRPKHYNVPPGRDIEL